MAVVSFADAVQDMPSPEMIEYICYCITCSMLACFITYNSTNRKKWEQSITLFYPLSGDNNICTCTVPYGDFYKVQLCNHSFISIQPYRPGWQEPEPSHVTNMALYNMWNAIVSTHNKQPPQYGSNPTYAYILSNRQTLGFISSKKRYKVLIEVPHYAVQYCIKLLSPLLVRVIQAQLFPTCLPLLTGQA